MWGTRFEHLRAIFEGAKTASRLGVCFDTQHAFAAGYDLSTDEGYEKTWSAFGAFVGFPRLRAFHLNDSKKPLGARVDWHEHLGEGEIGLPAFWRLANDARFATIPAVLETEPREGAEPFKAEVQLLEGLVGAERPKGKPAFALEVVEAKGGEEEGAEGVRAAGGGSSYSGGGPAGRTLAPPHPAVVAITAKTSAIWRIEGDRTTLFRLTRTPPRCTFRAPAGISSRESYSTRASAQSTRPPAQTHTGALSSANEAGPSAGRGGGRRPNRKERAMTQSVTAQGVPQIRGDFPLPLKSLLDAGVHFGHQTKRWNPKMRPFIYGARNGIHIIDLDQTTPPLQARVRLRRGDASARGGHLLLIGTKRQAQEIVQRGGAPLAAASTSSNRWLGGTLTNFRTIKQGLERMRQLERMKEDGTYHQLPKKEVSQLEKERERSRSTSAA